jgi:ABC-type multidrug transport system fused ATPase/permease subunit
VLSFIDVSFAYAQGAALALDEVSLTLEPGQVLVVVGRTAPASRRSRACATGC